jgi:hypothetical protein
MLDMIHYKKFTITELQDKLPSSDKPSGIPVMNQTHPNQTPNLILLIWTFILSSNQYVAAQLVQ